MDANNIAPVLTGSPLLNSGTFFENMVAGANPKETHIPASCEETESVVEEPLTFRLNNFRLKGIGCDVLFVVGVEKEVYFIIFGFSLFELCK